MTSTIPSRDAFTPAERRLIARLRTPAQVQKFLSSLPYNAETNGESLRGFREVARRRTAHCAEAALFAACVMEQRGYPPLLLILRSYDYLDHVLFLYRRNGRWGTVARSRDPGLHGRKPVFKTLRALMQSYFDPYVDSTGHITGYATADLRDIGNVDWRFSHRNVWAVERFVTRRPHKKVKSSPQKIRALRQRYNTYREQRGKKPLYYSGRKNWLPIPKEFY